MHVERIFDHPSVFSFGTWRSVQNSGRRFPWLLAWSVFLRRNWKTAFPHVLTYFPPGPSGRLYCTISHTTMQNVDPAVSLDANQPQILCCKFNPTGNSILATTLKGFIIYALDKDGNVNVQHEYDVGTEIKFAERLYSTNLVAYATAKNPDVFVVFHCKRRKIVCDFRYPSDIDVVRFNRQRVIIAIKDAVSSSILG